MKKIAAELLILADDYSEKLSHISEDDFSKKPFPEKWSRKEELGHLVDSAHTNLRRFIVGQYDSSPKIVYNQNFWVKASNYQHQSSKDLILLWKMLNQQISEVLKNMDENNYSKSCDTGKQQVELHSLEWLADDYIIHLKHHLHHILQLEAISY